MQRKRLLSEVDGNDLGHDDLSIDVNVRVIVHAPLFFKSIQQANGVTSEVLIESLHPKYNRDMVFKVGEGAGASGSFFFFSADRRFIIKTMTEKEMKVFLSMLPYYEIHLSERKQSLLARIYGVYTIKMDRYSKDINIMLMANTLQFKEAKNIVKIFDIKGSKVKRDVEFTPGMKNTTILKDINFLRLIDKDPNKLRFMQGDIQKLESLIKRDVQFLHG